MLWLLAASSAHAQRSYDFSRFTPAPDGDGFLGITGTRTPGPFNTNFALVADYASAPFVLRSSASSDYRLGVVTDRVDLDALFQVGILGRFAIVVDAPVVAWQQAYAANYDAGPGISVVAIRDPRLSARARLLGEDATVERARHEGEGLALQFATTIPLGTNDAFAGEGAPVVEAGVLGDFHLLDFGIGGQLGFRHHFAEPTILGVSFRNQLYAGLAVQVPAFFLDHLVAIAEVDVTTDAENPFGNQSSTMCEWRIGGRYTIADTQITVAGGTGLVSGIGVPAGRFLVGVSFAPRVHDRDGDGITDDHDACVTLPEDFDDHEDEDGCPEPDNDGDLVPDLDDRCPNEAADFDLDADEDGCNDPVQDADADGVSDDVDACPSDAEDADGVDDGDGCPEDDDADGVPDASDGCRDQAEDRDGNADEDGCPDLDDDGDGIPDASDACPREAEDADGHDDADGCPDGDDDHDGVADATDQCRDQPETINGRTDDDGCPDAGRGAWTASGAVGTATFALTGNLRVRATTLAGLLGGSTIELTPAATLEQLRQWLRADGLVPHRIAMSAAAAARVGGMLLSLDPAAAPDASAAAAQVLAVAEGTSDGRSLTELYVYVDPALRGDAVRVSRTDPSDPTPGEQPPPCATPECIQHAHEGASVPITVPSAAVVHPGVAPQVHVEPGSLVTPP
jgi:hypothetical protein